MAFCISCLGLVDLNFPVWCSIGQLGLSCFVDVAAVVRGGCASIVCVL